MTAISDRMADKAELTSTRGLSGDAISLAIVALICVLVDLSASVAGDRISVGAQYIVVLCAIVVAPPRFWLHLSAGLTVLVPFTYLSSSNYETYFCPAIILLTVYLAHRRSLALSKFEIVVWAFLLLYCVFLEFFGSSSDLNRKTIWILLFVLIAVASTTFLDHDAHASIFRALICFGLTAAAFGIVEFSIGSNPLDAVYESATTPLTQKWPGYRILTTLGHPLVNGTVFAIAFTMIQARQSLRFSHYRMAASIVFACACILTASRTSILAVLCGTAACFLISLFNRNSRGAIYNFATIGLGYAAYVLISNPLSQRNGTADGQGSSDLRDQYLGALDDLLRTNDYLGTGAGSSSKAVTELGGMLGKYPIESSAVQIFVSLGLIGGVLVVALTSRTLLNWIRNRNYVGPASLLAYLVAASGFNLFEAYPSLLSLLVLILVLGNSENRSESGLLSGKHL